VKHAHEGNCFARRKAYRGINESDFRYPTVFQHSFILCNQRINVLLYVASIHKSAFGKFQTTFKERTHG